MTGLPYTPRLRDLLAAAKALAEQQGDEAVGVEHLQLSIFGDEDAVPTQVLRNLGCEPADFVSALEMVMGSHPYRHPQYRATRLDGTVYTAPVD